MEEREDIRALQTRMDGMAQKVDTIYYALMGNELTKDGGLVIRIVDLEKENLLLHEKIEQLERRNIKGELYVKWLWGLGGTLGYAVFMAILNHIFKK